MSILQFLRIFWARWLTIVIAMVSAAVGAFAVASLVQPRYEATARIMLSFAKPDPVTGQTFNTRGAAPYIDAQREMTRDYRVTGRVVDALDWLSSPGLIRAYARRPADDQRDFRRWLAERVTEKTQTEFRGSIMEIKYSAPSAQEAKAGAETLRTAYLEETLKDRQDYARKNANWYDAQAEVARKAAEKAELAKAAYEKESGIVLTDQNADVDSTRLQSLASQMAMASSPSIGPVTSQAALQLAQVDSLIAEQSQQLGPNHPRMVELRHRRELLARVAAQEQAQVGGASAAAAIGRQLDAQKARVIGQRDKVERLRQLQAEVDLRRDEYKRTAARGAQLSLEASIADAGATPLGVVVIPNRPAFPNKLLMVGGATGLGAVIGLALALLLELLNRRVRGVEDLDLDSSIPCIGIVEEPDARTRNDLRRLIGRLVPRRTGAIA